MISCLVVAICILALFQTSQPRLITAVIYAAVVGGYSLLAVHAPAGQSFPYFLGAFLDVAIIALIAVYADPTRLAGNLIDVCLISIVLNCVGFIVWFSGMPLDAYNLSYGALYLIAILSLLREERADGYQLNRRYLHIRSSVRRCAVFFGALPEQGA